VDCVLPTNLQISLSSSSSLIGFKVGIEGNISCNQFGLTGLPMLISYSVTNGASWNDITQVTSSAQGAYSAVWMPSATGNFMVKATWSGNGTYPKSTSMINLAVLPLGDSSAFSIASSDTVSNLNFDSSKKELSFTVVGPQGTPGYVDVFVSKTLFSTGTGNVYIDGNIVSSIVSSSEDSWIIHFLYSHSSHNIIIKLGENSIDVPSPSIPRVPQRSLADYSVYFFSIFCCILSLEAQTSFALTN
jgi:hypothetical protein